MSNPTFVQGPITYPASTKLDKFRLVTIADGKVKHAAATGGVIGAVTEKADPDNTALPTNIAVHMGPASVKLTVEGDATAIKAGAAVFAAADGKVAAEGTVQVGVAIWDGEGDRVLTRLFDPIANG